MCVYLAVVFILDYLSLILGYTHCGLYCYNIYGGILDDREKKTKITKFVYL